MKKQILFPKHRKVMEQVGEQIKLVRKRRKLTTVQVAERANIHRSTLYQIEKVVVYQLEHISMYQEYWAYTWIS